MAKIIFRPHKHTLDEAMKEAREFDSVDEMKQFIVEYYSHKGPSFSVDDLIINDESEIENDKNGWKDEKYVCTKRWKEEVYETPQCVGMCATIYPSLNPIIFRPHRLTLREEMIEVQQFNNFEEMKQEIANSLNKYHVWFTTDDIVIDQASAINDEQIGWFDQTRVCIKRWGEKIFSTPLCIGMCATDYFAPA
jgi:hypothetical protein